MQWFIQDIFILNTKVFMERNNRYIDINAIISIASGLYPGLDIQKTQATEWAGYAQMHDLVIIREWFLFKNVQLDIEQKKALLPCNCHKLLDVYREDKTRIKFRHDGSYIFFDDTYDDVYINYRGFPVDDEGRPLFIRGTEMALARYIIKNMHEQDFLTGKLDGQRWQYLIEAWEDARDVARANLRTLTRNEIEEMLQINADMVPKLGYIPIYNLD